MLKVVSTQRADEIIEEAFFHYTPETETVALDSLTGRVLAEDIYSPEDVPSFDRSTVDGYAVIAADTFGSSESMPCQSENAGEILMGQPAAGEIVSGQCMKIPTGGMLPKGADSAVMVENTEELFDGMTLIYKAVSPYENITKKGDDVEKGQAVLLKGTVLSSKHIGILAALGITETVCRKRIKIGIISSGDEVVPVSERAEPGKVRDINSHILSALFEENGFDTVLYGIIGDCYERLYEVTKTASEECDIILLSGGSSAGTRDMTVRVISDLGEVFLHGIAMKPGKPTIVGRIIGKPVFGLPGHPAAAYFTAMRFALPLAKKMGGFSENSRSVTAVTSANISSNHGREEFIPVKLENGIAYPIFRKSGVISLLCQADGYIVIDRNKEGLNKGEEVEVILL